MIIICAVLDRPSLWLCYNLQHFTQNVLLISNQRQQAIMKKKGTVVSSAISADCRQRERESESEADGGTSWCYMVQKLLHDDDVAPVPCNRLAFASASSFSTPPLSHYISSSNYRRRRRRLCVFLDCSYSIQQQQQLEEEEKGEEEKICCCYCCCAPSNH